MSKNTVDRGRYPVAVQCLVVFTEYCRKFFDNLWVILNPVDKSMKNCSRVGIAHPTIATIAQLVFKDLFQPHSV
jgi:hypothetical protein